MICKGTMRRDFTPKNIKIDSLCYLKLMPPADLATRYTTADTVVEISAVRVGR